MKYNTIKIDNKEYLLVPKNEKIREFEIKVFVIYFDITNMDMESIENSKKTIKTVTNSFQKKYKDIEFIIVPKFGETKIECIYPKFITDRDIIEETKSKINDINNLFLDWLEENKR